MRQIDPSVEAVSGRGQSSTDNGDALTSTTRTPTSSSRSDGGSSSIQSDTKDLKAAVENIQKLFSIHLQQEAAAAASEDDDT